MDKAEEKKILEAALLCAQEPLSLQDMANMFEETELTESHFSADYFKALLDEISQDWNDRGLELVNVANGWRFQSRAYLQPYFSRLKQEKPPRYSRATMETLAVIAYNQPVTRGDIEQIRGVTINAQAIRLLEERGWIEVIGHREVPGRPALFATTIQFLSDLGLTTLEDLPPLEVLQDMEVLNITTQPENAELDFNAPLIDENDTQTPITPTEEQVEQTIVNDASPTEASLIEPQSEEKTNE